MRLSIAFLSIAIMATSCASYPDYSRQEKMLSRAAKPLTVISVSRENARYCSVTFIDARGRVFTIDSESLGSLVPGDVITKRGVEK